MKFEIINRETAKIHLFISLRRKFLIYNWPQCIWNILCVFALRLYVWPLQKVSNSILIHPMMSIQNTKNYFPAVICVWVMVETDTADCPLKTSFFDSEIFKTCNNYKTSFLKFFLQEILFFRINEKPERNQVQELEIKIVRRWGISRKAIHI